MADALHIVVLGTCDTKLPELLYLRSHILSTPAASPTRVTLIDVGRSPTAHPHITVTQPALLDAYHRYPSSAQEPRLDLATAARPEVSSYMAAAATAFVRAMLHDAERSDKNDADAPLPPPHAIVAAGGSGNTALAAQVMRDAAPLGLPKLIVSTLAAGDVAPIVQGADLMLAYPVVDVAGLNGVLRAVLENAAGAVVGMAGKRRDRLAAAASAGESGQGQGEGQGARKTTRLGITMFGVTTPCVDAVRRALEASRPDVEPFVFHATGHGGRAMEDMVARGELDAVLDLTTTELADHLVGGNMSAGAGRLDAALARGLPCLLSVGACDMVNFGPRETVPERFRRRNLFVHNSQVTLMRTSAAECRAIGEFIVGKIKDRAARPDRVAVWLPKGGVSMLSTRGQPFEDRAADEALFHTITEGLHDTGVKVHESDSDINQSGTATELVKTLMGLIDA